MTTKNPIRTVLPLVALAMMILILPAVAVDIPEQLPDPDTTPPDTTKPVKVFILSGQSNMVGMGFVNGTEPGTLETVTKTDGLFPHMVDVAGNWTVRNDVWYEGVVTATAKKWLTVGCGANSNLIGPELQFGHIMGYYHDEPVIILKTSQGNRALGWDFLPPGSVQYDSDDGYTYPGYGGSPERWLTGTTPQPISWYAGKQYDDCVAAAKNVLDNFSTKFPQYANQGYEIAGFVWWQGHRDGGMKGHADRYELNMVNFINAFRAEFNAPDAPFLIATIGFNGWAMSGNQLIVANAQLAVSGETGNYPEFEGNVKTVESRNYWKSAAESPRNEDYHYNRNAETYMMVGDALGRGMAELLSGYSIDAGPDIITWSEKPVQLNATVQEGTTVSSYSWSADPDTGVVFSDAAVEDPTVTITKTPGTPVSVTLTLTVEDEKNKIVQDTLAMAIYDDACKAAISTGLTPHYIADYDQDCMIGLEDFSAMVASWLNGSTLDEFATIADQWLVDYRLTEPASNVLMGHWKFDETTGNIATDSTVHGYDGQVLNGGTWQPTDGKIGGALELDGVDDEVTLPAGILDPTEAFSVMMWVRLDKKLGLISQTLLQHDGTGRSFLYRQATDDKLCSYFGGTQTVSASAVFDTTGQWLHIGMTYDKTTLMMYVNGQLEASHAVVGEPASAAFIVGAFKAGFDKAERANWAGLTDDLRVYNRALTPSEITALAGD